MVFYQSRSNFLENLNGPYGPYHDMNTFGRMDLENMDPKTQKLTKSDFLKNDHVHFFRKNEVWARKKPCGMPQRQRIAFKHIPGHSRPNFDAQIQYLIQNFMKLCYFQLNSLKS